ncbi:MAG: N-acetylmuramoyl-L-alanine amidase family protein [Actinomycetota bacterium]
MPSKIRARQIVAAAVVLVPAAWWAIAKTAPNPSNAGKPDPPIATESAVDEPPSLAVPGVRFQAGACVSFPARGRSKAVVFLDAGHGGVDPGAYGKLSNGRSIDEKTATLALVQAATPLLQAAGYTVVVSRWTDTTIKVLRPADLSGGLFSVDGARTDLLARIACANAARANLLVSLHLNSFSDPREGGTLTFYDPDRTFSNANKRLAGLVQANVLGALRSTGLHIVDRFVVADTVRHGQALSAEGTRYGHEILIGPYKKGWVPMPSSMPAAICEVAFLTRPAEADIVMSARGRSLVGNALLRAVQQFLGA